MTTAQPTPSARRRWLSFSLRGMLLVVTAACIWLAIVSTRARKQEQAVGKVEKLGGGLHFDYQRDRQGRHLPKGEPATPEWLRKAVGDDYFRRVESVTFNYGRSRGAATDAELSIFRDLTGVTTLELSNNPITDAGLQHLSRLNQLRTLYLYRTKVRGPGLEHLPRGIRVLTLGHAPLEDEGLAHIREMRDLSSLDISHTKITDEGLAHLSQLNSLETLNLSHTDITDAGLPQLESLTNLKSLWLDRTRVTGQGVRQLRRSLPNCSISPQPDWLDAAPEDVELWPEEYKPTQAEIVAKITELGDARVAQDLDAPGQPIVSFMLFDSTISDKSLIRLLAEMPDLEMLNLRTVLVGDELAKELPRLKKLWYLSLADSRLTDKGLRSVGQMTSLRELSVSENEITADGLIHLAGLRNLQFVDTDNCDISEEGYAEFKRLLPKCQVGR